MSFGNSFTQPNSGTSSIGLPIQLLIFCGYHEGGSDGNVGLSVPFVSLGLCSITVENVKIEAATQTHATVTLQNYFRMYDKLAGMTGTADTEAFEFQHIYGLETVVIPTNKPMIVLIFQFLK